MLTSMREMTQPAAVLIWVHTWHYTTSAVIGRLLMEGKDNGDKLASNLMRRMVKQNWLRQVDNDALQGQYVYMLSPDGLEEVLASGAGARGIDYDLKPASIRHDTLRHDLGVQFIVAHQSNRNAISQVIPESVLRKARPLGKIPDAVMMLDIAGNQQARIAIEFEREEKAGDRLERFLWNVASDLAEDQYDMYMIYSRIPGIMQNYERAAKGPLRIWQKNPQSKRWEDQGKKTIPPEILEKIRFRFLPELSAALSPMSYRRQRKTAGSSHAAS